MDTTRLDVSKRFELLSNRQKYLLAEIESLQSEFGALDTERMILKQLKELYDSNPHDMIDEFRTQPTITPIVRPSSGKTQADCILELLPATRQDLISKLGYTGDQVAKVIHNLKTRGQIKETAPLAYDRA